MTNSPDTEVLVDVEGVNYTAVLTPDPRAGGFIIQVKELPGAFTEADSVEEAVEMVRDVVELYLAEIS